MGKSTTSLSTELRQKQKLTPLQMQFGRMLEMTDPEAEEVVQRALDEMPALEAVDKDNSDASIETKTEDGENFTETDRDMMRADFSSEDDVPDYLYNNRPTEMTAGIGSGIFDSRALARRNTNTGNEFTEPIIQAPDETLLESLEKQLSEISLSEKDGQIALYIIGNINDNGYMLRPLQAIADDLAIKEGIEVEPEHMRHIWELVRKMEPAGVGATDLRDCLLLQLQRMPRTTESLTAREVIENQFEQFRKKHFDKIANALDISRDNLQNALDLINRLNPKPGSAMVSSAIDERTSHITPDFSVEVDANGKITLTLLSRIPELRVEETFANDSLMPQGSGKRIDEAKQFIRSKRDEARNFIKIVTLRQQTLFRVMSAIVKLQRDFFISEEDEDIHPMVLRDIAAITGDDLSVISRATQEKYVATVGGIYPLKKFFNEKVREGDDSITVNRIIAEIKNVIESEDPKNPFSDREITDRIANAGYDIARRTVAKYRESLGFPVARLRKKR